MKFRAGYDAGLVFLLHFAQVIDTALLEIKKIVIFSMELSSSELHERETCSFREKRKSFKL